MIKKNESYKIGITGITDEGNGVGRIDGFTVFVPDTAIGDICDVLIVKVNKSFGYGKLLEILIPSNDRIDIDCDVFNRCGGCSYRHISYEAELKIKHDVVANAFKRIGGFDIEVSPIIGSVNDSKYRNKAQYPFAIEDNNMPICGFYAKRSHRVVSSDCCQLQPDIFADIQKEVLNFICENGISIYDEQHKEGLLRHLYLRYAEKTGELMLCLVATSYKIPQIDLFIKSITEKFSYIKSIVINKNSNDTNVILGNECKTVFGIDTITDILCDIKIMLSPLSFYQVNRCQAETLYTKAIEYSGLSNDDVLIDLYCGTGTIGLATAKKVKQLIGVEITPEAVRNAKENADINGITNAEFICADAGKAAQTLADRGIKPNVIIVDPPRKGIDSDVISAIEKMGPDRLVMVSCNPATAARDCKLLVEKEYEILAVTPVDMFPRTTHVECVVKMMRKDDTYGKMETISG